MARQQTQRDHHVRLAAAHGLGQLEDRLIRLAGQPQQAFAEQLRHAVGDEVAREELAPVAGVANEIGQVLDALAHPVVVDGRVEAACLLDGLDHECVPERECSSAMTAAATLIFTSERLRTVSQMYFTAGSVQRDAPRGPTGRLLARGAACLLAPDLCARATDQPFGRFPARGSRFASRASR